MSWAQKRRLIYILGFTTIFLSIVIPLIFYFFYQEPTCSDNKQNQNELGVDCGGPCELLCSFQYIPLNVLWSRFSWVSENTYHVIAYIENPNFNFQANDIDYIFKLYDSSGKLIAERSGQTFIPANRINAIFEADLIAEGQPKLIEFSISTPKYWSKKENAEKILSISGLTLSDKEAGTNLNFKLSNNTVNFFKKIELIAIVYDGKGLVKDFSRTIVDSLSDKESRLIDFNWFRNLGGNYSRSEIITKILE